MVKIFSRWILILTAIIGLLLTAMIMFSPYGKHKGFESKMIQATIEINVSKDSVFRYLGNSDNASKWSVYVSKIEPLNADRFPDGSIGGRRRCYSSQGKGIRWDELISEVVPNEKRQLLIYNMVNFPVSASDLATEQHYESLGENKCLLTFTLFYKNNNPTWMETLKTYFASYKVESVFKRNLANIKQITQGKSI